MFIGAEHSEDFGVTGVGRLTAEDDRTPRRSAEDLVDERELDLAVALAAEFGSEMACPQALFAHRGLQRPDELGKLGRQRRIDGVLVLMSKVIERLDLVADECVHPVELCLELGSVLKSHMLFHPSIDSKYGTCGVAARIGCEIERGSD